MLARRIFAVSILWLGVFGSAVAGETHWAYRPIAVPNAEASAADSTVDQLIHAKLHEHGLNPACRASRSDLIRRLYMDLIGLPPSPEEIRAFVADDSPDAYATLVERLLADERYGQRWARHWLDVVRYAESDGYKADVYRPDAWRYRDYVIESFNADKPYDRFVAEQLAGDELFPDDPQAIVATGYLRAGPYEDNQADIEAQWNLILTELTDTTSEVFLGMSMGCARCHDHKFDPITQVDYYRMRAFFESVRFDNDLRYGTPEQRAEYEAKRGEWLEASAELRRQIAELEAPYMQKKRAEQYARYPRAIKAILDLPEQDRTPWQQQLAHLSEIQTSFRSRDFDAAMPKDVRSQWVELRKQLKREFGELEPKELPGVLGVRDMGPVAPETRVANTNRSVQPGIPAALGDATIPIAGGEHTTGRRSALARWITDPANPLTARVMVNRIWQHHFGRGLVDTPNDFGSLGTLPTHPQLLDWLAGEFIASGWSVKHVHRLILQSQTYQQSARRRTSTETAQRDPDNRLLWRFPTRRLDGEMIRDAMLAATGELELSAGGPSAERDSHRRSIYVKVERNKQHPLLAAFDCPVAFGSTPARPTTTTAPQALLLLNHPWVMQRAEALAERLQRERPEDAAGRIALAYQLTFGRSPTQAEQEAAAAFLQEQAQRAGEEDKPNPHAAWVDLCHALLNANEFLYVN